MKFCYVDETGIDGSSPLAVMAGVTVDAVKIRRANRQFDEMVASFFASAGRPVRELKGRDLHRGKKAFGRIDPELRHRLIDEICGLVAERGLRVALAALDLDRLRATPSPSGVVMDSLSAGGLHVALQLQRMQQSAQNNKDLTVLVFDENKMMVDVWADLLHQPPAWCDAYYGRKNGGDPLPAIIDSAFYAKSHHARLIQVADVVASVFHRHAEICDYAQDDKYDGESAAIAARIGILGPRLIPRRHRHPSRSPSEAARWFNDLAPSSLVRLG